MASDEYSAQDMPSLLRRLQEIATVVMQAAEADSLAGLLERIADAARELVGAKYSALGVPDGKGGLELFEFSGMERGTLPMIGHLPRGRGLIGAIMREAHPIRLDSMKEDARFVGFPPNHPRMDRFLGVPIRGGGQLLGQIYLTDKVNGEAFNEQDQWLIEMLAGYAALAIAGAQLRDQQRRVALLEERERISMELHDGVIQSLYAIGMSLELMRTNPQPPAPSELTPIVANLNDVIDDIRSYIQNLKMRERYGRTLREFVYDITRRLHIPRQLKVELDTPNEALIALSPTVYEAMCQMANEALSNVIRHSHAHHVRIAATQDERVFQLKIADDGVGFNDNQVDSGEGLGLRNIRERARMHGGDVYIDSAPGRGTCITFTLPLQPALRPA
jgi:signal transduction histidine kinase